MLSASAALIAGGAVPSTAAFSAPAAPHLVAVPTASDGHGGHGRGDAALPAVDWVETTDAASGVTVELPGKAAVQKVSLPGDGKTVNVRLYRVNIPDGDTGFIVHDMPGDRQPLEEQLQGTLDVYNDYSGAPLTSADIQRTTVDGHPALDARLSTEGDGDPMVGFIRVIADDNHLVQVLTLGPEANEKALNEMHERIVTGIRVP